MDEMGFVLGDPGMQRTGRLSGFGAPSPAPLHHRANKAQMKNGLYFQPDERWGPGHRGPRGG